MLGLGYEFIVFAIFGLLSLRGMYAEKTMETSENEEVLLLNGAGGQFV